MKQLIAYVALWLSLTPVFADTVMSSRTIGSNTVLSPDDLVMSEQIFEGAFTRFEQVVGLETNVIIYAGQPIAASALRRPTLIERNSKVALVFSFNGLEITTEGRALGRASLGDHVEVLNLTSRNTVSGVATSYGRVNVGAKP